jgi:putative oxidoreductase
MATPDGKDKRITLVVLSILLALVFLLAGGSKLLNPEMHFQDFEEWGYAPWFVSVVGVIEVVGGVVLLAPFARFSSKTRFYGAMLLAVDMLGATATHLKAGQMNRFPVPLVLCIAVSWSPTVFDPLVTTPGLRSGKLRCILDSQKGDSRCDPACFSRTLQRYLPLPHGHWPKSSLSVTR